MVYSNKMLLWSFWFNVSHDTSISLVWYYWPTPSFLVVSYSSLSLSPLYPCLPTLSCSAASPPLSPLSFGALVPCSDCIWHDLYNGFTALCALRGIAGIPEYFPASLKVNVFFPVPSVIGVSIYHSLAVCFPWQHSVCVRNTFPSAALHCKQVGLMCSSHSFILSLLKSGSALLFINCCFINPLVFPMLLRELSLLQCTNLLVDRCAVIYTKLSISFTVFYSDYWPLPYHQPLPEAFVADGMKASSETPVPSPNEAVWSLHTPPLIGCWTLAGRCAHSGYAALVLCNRKKSNVAV